MCKGVLSGLFKSRDKPTNRTNGSAYSFLMGGSSSGRRVNERSAMQMTAVYSCVRILSEAVASLPLHVYLRTDIGTEKAIEYPLYKVLHDEPNPEMTSFVFRETMMTHLLLWGNAYAQIIRNGKGEVLGLYPLMPDRMKVDRDDKGQICYEYFVSDSDAGTEKQGIVKLNGSDVLHIPGLGFDGLVGYSPIKEKQIKNASKDKAQYQKYKEILGRNAPKSLAEFVDIKYNKDRWELFKSYAKAVRIGELTPLADFSLYEKIDREINEKLVNKKLKNGYQIEGYSKHYISRTIGSAEQKRTGVPVADSVKILEEYDEIRLVREDKKGVSQKIVKKGIGIISINSDTKKLIQVNPHKKK